MLQNRGSRLIAWSGSFLPNHPPQNLTIATTGASGAMFLRQLLLAVERDQRITAVNFIASDSALRVMAEELGLRGRSKLVGQLLGDSARDTGHNSRKIKNNRTLTSEQTWPAALIPPTP